MKKLISVLILTLLLTSCVDQNNKNNSSSNRAKKDIKALKQTVEQLNDKLNTSAETSNQEQIDQIRIEIQATTKELDTQIDAKIAELKLRLDEHQARIGKLEENQISQGQVRLLLHSFEEQFREKQASLLIQLKASLSEEEKSEVFLRLSQLAQETQQFREEFRAFQNSGVLDWKEQLTQMLVDSEGRVTEEIRALLREEILKLKVSQEGLRAQINNQPKDGLHETPQINNHLNVMNTTNLNHLEEELNEEIEETIQENFTEDPSVVADIISKLFEPCTKSLKEDKYCYTSGALIHKLGGLFIDPMSFEKNKIDLLTYLSLSGIKLKASLHKIDKYITSGMPNLFAKCFPDETHMIAPRKYWPRLVIISLIFEKIENDINLKKEMGLIPEEVAPVTHFVAWYRNLCYQQGVTGRQNVNSDHMYGAALDASFVEQSTLKTFAHYKNFIQKNIIDNDIFGIVHPLKSSNLTISVGLGHGKGAHGMGKLHLGIMSEIDGGDGIRTWTY